MLAHHVTTSSPPAPVITAEPGDANRLMLFALRRLEAAFVAAAERGSQTPTPTELKRVRAVTQVAIAAAERGNGEHA